MRRAGPIAPEGGDQTNPTLLEHREQLLSTKLFLPSLRPNRVNRSRLIAQLNTGLDKALILVSAPAGYGKTTLVSNWVHESTTHSSWLSLDEGDNDLLRFSQYFIAALQKIVPSIPADLYSLLQGTQPTPVTTLLNILINEISAQKETLVLILDDFHVIHAQAILDMVVFLLEHRPPQFHLLLLSRTDPPLPLFRLRARDQLVEIRAEQLRFTQGEVAVFLNENLGLRLCPEDIVAMQVRTEGWAAGLQLAALSLLGHQDAHRFVSAFTGSHHYIMDYLTEEVLKLQPESIRTFLLQTSILTSMCGSLCEAVVDPDGTEPNSGQAMLEMLEAMNLFVIALDDRRQWYRYHHLFADVIQLRLTHAFPELLPELHRLATNWYEKHEMIFEATHHAILAGDQARAVQFVEQNGCSLLMRGEGFTLLKWVESVATHTQTHPWLSILKAWGLALTRQLDQVEPSLRIAEGLFSPLETAIEAKIMLGSIAAARAFMANLHEETQLAAHYAGGALEYLPASNDFSCSMRSVATTILGDASWINGNLEAAKRAYLEAGEISQAAGNIYMTMVASSNHADVLFEQGELHQAARIYSDTLANATRADGQELPLADRLYAGMGQITYEWNQLESANQYFQRGIQLCLQCGNTDLLAKEYIALAWLERARSNLDQAHEALEAAELLLNEQRLSPRQAAWVKQASAHWWISQGSLERASQLVQHLDIAVNDEIPYTREFEYLLLLRLLLAKDEYGAARSLSERLLHMAESEQRTGLTIKILALQALIFQGQKNIEQALEILAKALSLAQPQGFARVFLDEGQPMQRLLYLCKSNRIGREYASKLISGLSGVGETVPTPSQLLIEPLTAREMELLKLIEDGWNNQEIAGKLFISIPTVKRHISNIYAKLGARSRTQAVALGRELKLFE